MGVLGILGNIAMVYFTVYVIILNYGYHLTLPWYSRSEQLETGRNFHSQWRNRYRSGKRIMRTVTKVYLIATTLILFNLAIIPLKQHDYTPEHLSVHHDVAQNMTIIIADSKVYTAEYEKEGKYLVNNLKRLEFAILRPLLFHHKIHLSLLYTKPFIKINTPP